MQVIPVDDDDGEVEVMYTKIKPTTSQFMQISQELQLLQAFCKSSIPIPMEYNSFYIRAKEVNTNYSDNIILSAWKRAITKQILNLKSSASCCEPQATSTSRSDVTLPSTPLIDLTDQSFVRPGSQSLSVPPSPPTTPPPLGQGEVFDKNTLPSQDVIPVALFVNQNFQDSRSNVKTFNSNKTEMSSKTPVFGKESVTDVLNTDSDNFEPKQKTCKEISDLVEEIVMDNKKEKRKNSSDNFFNSLLESKLDPKLQEQIPDMQENEELDINDMSVDESENESSCETADFYSKSDSDSSSSDDYNYKPVHKRRKWKYKLLNRSHTLADLSKNKNHTVVQSHIGVQAKIKKSKFKSTLKFKTVNARLNKTISEAELKHFKAELKKQKLLEKRLLANKQLEIVHDRLVDVLIPKYFNKDN